MVFTLFPLFCTEAHYFTLWYTHIALWRHPTLQSTNIIELLPMNIITYLGGKYAASHHIIDLVGAAANIHNPAVSTQTLLGKSDSLLQPHPYQLFLPRMNKLASVE